MPSQYSTLGSEKGGPTNSVGEYGAQKRPNTAITSRTRKSTKPILVRRRLQASSIVCTHSARCLPSGQRLHGLDLEGPERLERIETGVAGLAHRRPVLRRGLMRIVRMSATRFRIT